MINVTTENIVNQTTTVTRGRVLMNIAEGIETEDMPCPTDITFYEAGSPDWDLANTLAVTFADNRDMQIWMARLGWMHVSGPTASRDGRRLIYSAIGDFHGWKVNAKAYDPAVTE